ncbi:uncharacterized protein, partial [Cicer arietinum]|uniref:Uncharacterized protein LOC113786689 n=1 Tax=Cicer arietinum TaxID=3827 RepID=A0A3Q7Y0A5_CICAR
MKPNSELKTTWLYGNRKRMKIDSRDDLLDIFLDYRANILSKCSAPLSGWKHHLELMVLPLDNIGNGETLMNSGSIWEVLVLDAIARGCFHSADEDERLSHVIAIAIIELGQVGDLLNMNYLLFRKARWKVCFNQSFRFSMTRINSTEDCKK